MCKVKLDWTSCSRENYKDFRKTYPNITIPFNVWKKIVRSFNNEFMLYVLETGERVRLSGQLGSFAIQKKKRRQFKGKNNEFINLPVDWVKTKERGKIVYNFNFETEGYFFGWKWFKPRAAFLFSELWDFKPTRPISRLITKYVRDGNKYRDLYQDWSKLVRR